MNTLDTLYFPGTDIHSVRQYPLFLMFQKVHLITPVEGDPVEGGKESPDSFIKSGFCQVHTPCPLGADRSRFLHLVEDIKNRKDDYAAQLSSLTLAAMTPSGTPAEDSERAIVRSLYGQTEPEGRSQEREKADQLWQARLVLAIGELLDHEEEEIAMHMAMLEEEEKGLFQELQGEDDSADEDNPFAELSLMKSKLHGSHAGNIKKRFQAWRTLFSASAMECPVLLTGSPDSGDLLLEMYDKKIGQPAPQVAELPLPAFVGWNSAEAGQMVREFAEKHRELLARLEGALGSLAAGAEVSGDKECQGLQELTDPWAKALDGDFPADRFGRIPVKIYLLPKLSCSAILSKVQSTAVNGSVNGILAVVG